MLSSSMERPSVCVLGAPAGTQRQHACLPGGCKARWGSKERQGEVCGEEEARGGVFIAENRRTVVVVYEQGRGRKITPLAVLGSATSSPDGVRVLGVRGEHGREQSELGVDGVRYARKVLDRLMALLRATGGDVGISVGSRRGCLVVWKSCACWGEWMTKNAVSVHGMASRDWASKIFGSRDNRGARASPNRRRRSGARCWRSLGLWHGRLLLAHM